MGKKIVLSLAFASFVLSLGTQGAFAQSVWMDPVKLDLPAVGNTGTMHVKISGIPVVAGAELYITFDPNVVNAFLRVWRRKELDLAPGVSR